MKFYSRKLLFFILTLTFSNNRGEKRPGCMLVQVHFGEGGTGKGWPVVCQPHFHGDRPEIHNWASLAGSLD